MVSLAVNTDRERAPADARRVAQTSLSISATALPVWFILVFAGCLTGIFMFLPWSPKAGQIVFIVVSILFGLLFAGLHWALSRNRSVPSLHVREVPDPCTDNGIACHHLQQQQEQQQQEQEQHRGCASCFVCSEGGRCSFPASCWHTRFRDALPALELLILGVLVLLSPHVMVNRGGGNDIVVSPNRDYPNGILYPVEIAWKVCALHFLFLFSAHISIVADLVIGVLHFIALMVNFRRFGSGTILVSVVWFILPFFGLLVAVIQHQRRLRWQERCQQQRREAADMFVVNNTTSTAHPNAVIFRDALDTAGRTMSRPNMFGGSGQLEMSERLPAEACRSSKRCGGNDTQNTEPLISEVHQYRQRTDLVSTDPHYPYLVLSVEDHTIKSASVGFAAHMGVTVENLEGQKLAVVLKELEVENVGDIMGVVHTVARPVAVDSHSQFATVASVSKIANYNREKTDSQLLQNGSNSFGANVLSKEFLFEQEVGFDVDGGDYSTIQGTVTSFHVDDADVQRVLLRGRRPLQRSIIKDVTIDGTLLPHPRSGTSATAAAAAAVDDGCGSSNSSSSSGSGGGNYIRSPAPGHGKTPSALCFSLLLDVWVEQQNGTSDAVIVLRQPRLHWALDCIPLPCFLVHPTTGRVLYWSRAAARQTGQVAYKMVGWPVQVAPLPESLVVQNDNGSNRHNMEGEEQHQRRNLASERLTRLESPLQAILQLPFSGAGSLKVSLQPITGESLGDETAALDNGVAGLVWPPRYYANTEAVIFEARREAGYPRDNGNYSHVSGTMKSTQQKQSNTVLQSVPMGSVVGANGRGFVNEPRLSVPGVSWYFSALSETREDVNAWANLGVPLLFVIQDGILLSDSPNDIYAIKQEQLPSKHSLTGVMRERYTTPSEKNNGNAKENMLILRVNEEVVHPKDTGKRKHLKEKKDLIVPVGMAVQRSRSAAGLIEAASSVAGINNTLVNEGNHSYTDGGDEHALRSGFCGSGREISLTSETGVVGPKLTPYSTQTSLYEGRIPSPLLMNQHKRMGNERNKHPLHTSNGNTTAAPITTTTTNNNNNSGRGDDDGRVDRNCVESNSGRDDGSVAGTALRKLRTPMGGRSSSTSKNTSIPRLISPPPVECPVRTTVGDADMSAETVLSGKLGSGDPHRSYIQQQQQQHGRGVMGSDDDPYHSTHQLQEQMVMASSHATPSGAESIGVTELTSSPAIHENLSMEGQPPWAMLKSSDETTIASYFIRVLPGEAFRFGRSSKCHGTTSDALVSSIHFTIVRELYQQSQFGEFITHSYDNSNTNNNNTDTTNDDNRGSRSGKRRTSSVSSPCYPQLSGGWVAKLCDTSANGTYVNVKKVGKGNSCVLHDRDLVTFRLNSTRFFLGFQFLLTDERGVPLRESKAAMAGSRFSRVSSFAMSRRSTPHQQHQHSLDNGSPITGSGTQANGEGLSVNASVSGGRRASTATRSQSGRPGSGTRHRETIEWKIGEEELGSGGNAKVYLGMNFTNGQLIAVKRVPLPATAADDQSSVDVMQQYRSLQKEINVLSKAVHPNIVQYYGSSQNKTHFNILLEFVPGGSLRHLLDNFGVLSPGVIFSYLRQMLEGLRYLHQHNIVHSDIKAANILITDTGRVKLTDFGTAKLLTRQHSQSLNRAGEAEDSKTGDAATVHVAGTLRWMAPELFRDSSSTGPTKASDIWSVGCVLIEMISTEAPWHEYDLKTEGDIIALLKYSEEPPEVPECSEFPEMRDIAKCCLVFSPEERPTCEDLLQLVGDATERFQQQQEKLSPSRDTSPERDSVAPVVSRAAATPIVATPNITGGVGVGGEHEALFYSIRDTTMVGNTASGGTGGVVQQRYGSRRDLKAIASKEGKETS